MRKIIFTVAAAATLLAANAFSNRADAMSVGDPAGIRAAVEDIAVTDQVHCRPGWWHHRFRPHDGCFLGRRAYFWPFFYPRRFVVHRPFFFHRRYVLPRPFFFHRRFVAHRPFFIGRPFRGARFAGGGFRHGFAGHRRR